MARGTLLRLLITLCAMASGLLIGCAARPCREQAADYLKQQEALFAEWKDAEDIAGATGRIALAQPVARLQELRRKANNLKVPTCAQPHLDAFKKAMDETVAAYLAFMAQKGDDEVNAHFMMAAVEYSEMTKAQLEMMRATGVRNTHAVKYEVAGTSSEVKLGFSNENGDYERLTVTVPWDKQFAANSGQRVMLSVDINSPVDATITCAIWIDGKQLDAQTATGRGVISCSGSVP